MQVCNVNNVKVYNLSAGKSLPDWITDKKRRKLEKDDTSIRRRLELIQDFDMPGVSHCVKLSPDGQFICATGTYKPRFKCYDVNELCLKFERGLDADVVNFELLSEDYSKVCFLQDDRYVEFHTPFGRHLRMRIPKFGRDLAFYPPASDMYFVGKSSEIYRINLEKGRFMKPLETSATEFNCCEFNPANYLFGAGSRLGHLECWDPRDKTRCGVLDIATSNFIQEAQIKTIPEITAMKFRNDGLSVALGTSTGHILLYDLRARKPFYVKDHNYELPIKSIDFKDSQDLVMSMDAKILKIWNRNTGQHMTSVEPGVDLNQLCAVPNSGLFFMANESPKLFTYFIPSLGPAPRWCVSLDNITEELEEKTESTVYDDYKFVTRTELEDLGLDHLIGSNLLKSVMHGFFLDIRLYHRAKSVTDPFAFVNYRKTKIKEKIEAERQNRVKLKSQKFPAVNRDLAKKLIDEDEAQKINPNKEEHHAVKSILKDARFSAMFDNPDFQIDAASQDFRLINPMMVRLDKARKKRQEKRVMSAKFKEVEGADEVEGRPSDDESSSDDEGSWTPAMRKQQRDTMRQLRQEEKDAEMEEERKARLFEIKDGEEIGVKSNKNKKKEEKLSLAERLERSNKRSASSSHVGGSLGNREIKFSVRKQKKEATTAEMDRRNEHIKERTKLKRSGKGLLKKGKSMSKMCQ